MKLLRNFFSKTQAPALAMPMDSMAVNGPSNQKHQADSLFQTSADRSSAPASNHSTSNVFQLHTGTAQPHFTVTPNASGNSGEFTLPTSAYRFKGLKNAPELEAFFDQGHFGHGRHAGASSASLQGLELGRQSLISEFQSTVTELAGCRQAKLDQIQLKLVDIAGVSNALSGQLELAATQVQREIDLLDEQERLAEHGKGWVLEALNKYQQGFERGVRESLEFNDLLG